LPMLINKATHEGIGFLDALAEGEKLVFDIDGKVYLNGEDVTERCYYFKGTLMDDSFFDNTDPKHLYCVVQPEGALDLNIPRKRIVPLAKLPTVTLPLGESDWRFSVQEGIFDACEFNQAVFAFPDDEQAINELPTSGKVELRWLEHEPFAVTILIPQDLNSLEGVLLDNQDLRKLVRAGLERFRTAGIKVSVDYFSEQWSFIEDIKG
ncbi:MAG: hypothetical protein AB1489_38545, partial [Acidobacteriota bacterium]